MSPCDSLTLASPAISISTKSFRGVSSSYRVFDMSPRNRHRHGGLEATRRIPARLDNELGMVTTERHAHLTIFANLWLAEAGQMLRRKRPDAIARCVVRGESTTLHRHGVIGTSEDELRGIPELKPLLTLAPSAVLHCR